VFDVTLDCEDGAPVGDELAHAQMVADCIASAPKQARLALRVHDLAHPAFKTDLEIIVRSHAQRLAHVMLPKVESVEDVDNAVAALEAIAGDDAGALPLHVLIESSLSVHNAFSIAAHPRVQSLSFGLMDFVSSHDGAIPALAMSLDQQYGQFTHPLVLRAKLQIAAAAHAYGKTPSHCVVTEFKDTQALLHAATQASQQLGFTRMWSIHPDQIPVILQAMRPNAQLLQTACEIILEAIEARWAPISYKSVLHDRASYRYYWRIIEKAYAAGHKLEAKIEALF
jgi:citrate lyase subunit beta/citryl-CoA lyase